tara:strand:+ start:1053 stop:1217 length:165 start_codon:yes stop_codon:yes gene_type:complete
MDVIIALFLVLTSALVGFMASASHAAGVQGMPIIIIGCAACFVGGWIIIAKELS